MGRPPEQGPASLRGGWTGLSGCGCGVAGGKRSPCVEFPQSRQRRDGRGGILPDVTVKPG